MNADKLADVLRADIRRCLDDVATEFRAYGRDETRFVQLIARMDAQPAQAAQPVGVPDGWVMVPREPTAEMAQIGRHAAPYRATDVYRAMVLAAPQPPAQPSADAEDAEDAAALIERDLCELDPADPDNPSTIAVSIKDLRLILDRHVRSAARAAEGGE